MEENRQRLLRMFRREKVLEMSTLGDRFPSRSRRSLFRDLAQLGYLTSYSHAGRLGAIPISGSCIGLWDQ
jgi:hypothetical protein